MNVNIPDQSEVLDYYGEDIQSVVHMEECGELIQAISKLRRAIRKNPDNYPAARVEHLIEEIGDVLICMEQLKLMYGFTDADIEAMVRAKCRKRKEKMQG